jgi:ribosome maturation factor RimP
MKILQDVTEIVEPIVKEHQLELIDIEYKKTKRGGIVRIFIDKKGGVTLEDCKKVSEEVGWSLDQVIPHTYRLEVSSPGVQRVLKKEKEFIWYKGRIAKIITSKGIEGQKVFVGRLDGLDGGKVILCTKNGKKHKIPLETVTKAKLEMSYE